MEQVIGTVMAKLNSTPLPVPSSWLRDRDIDQSINDVAYPQCPIIKRLLSHIHPEP
jgi:hypothetical protein